MRAKNQEELLEAFELLIGIGRRSPADPCHTTVHTGPYTAIRVGYASAP
ncbi:MAG: hypothetical protein WBL82_07315 [Terriglobales bacterium]